MNTLLERVGIWKVGRQPGGLWIAARYNPTSPGYIDKLPKSGAFRSENEARSAIHYYTAREQAKDNS